MQNRNRQIRFLLIVTMLCWATLYGAAQQQRWWGYYADGVSLTNMGTQTAETYTCAVQCRTAQPMLNGAKVNGVCFFLRDKTNLSDVKVWVSTSLPDKAANANVMVIEVSQEQLVDYEHDQAMVEVMLPTAYAITDNVYVSYEFKVNSTKTDADKKPVLCTGAGSGLAGSFWMRSTKTLLSWNNLVVTYGALPLQLLLSNEQLPQQAVQVSEAGRLVAQTGTTLGTTLLLQSTGFAEVRHIDYAVSVGGVNMGEYHYDLPSALWGAGSEDTLPVQIAVPATATPTTYAVQVTKVNGLANEEAQPTATNKLLAVEQLGRRRTVVEEFTGTWCVNCPRGIVGMHNLSVAYPDDFIGMAVHVNEGATKDPMYIASYDQIAPAGVPKCVMDRLLWCDPYVGIGSDYHFHAHEAFELMLGQHTEADVAITTRWTDAEETQLQLTATTTFYTNDDEANYALAFVLTEDGMKGTTKEWWQVNGESGKNTFPDADMDWFRNAPNPVQEIEYNHVAVAAIGVTDGIEGSIQRPIVSRQAQQYSVTYDVSQNAVIQDKNRLTAIVLLLNRQTGHIVNAAKTQVNTTSAVSGVKTAEQSTDVWTTMDGRKVSSPQRKGIYLKNQKKIFIK